MIFYVIPLGNNKQVFCLFFKLWVQNIHLKEEQDGVVFINNSLNSIWPTNIGNNFPQNGGRGGGMGEE